MDKVKPLGFENASLGGTGTYPLPTELNPSEDFIAVKGISFENLEDYTLEKIGSIILEKTPNNSVKPTYLGSGDPDFIEIFSGFTQTTPNRIAKIVLSYSSGLPTSETIFIYDSDGTTILRTITKNYTYVSDNLTKEETSTT